ncbi:MAG: sensor histidine kinase [Spirochaetaceae bacterium]
MTILPVVILTWVATDNTLKSVEKEIIDANSTKVNWAGQYLDDLIQQFDDLFYTLQIDDDFVDVIEASGKLNSDKNYVITNALLGKLRSSFYSNSRTIDKLDLYFNSSGQEISISAAISGNITYPNITIGKWSTIINGPVSLRLKPISNSIYVIHSINAFADRRLLGGMAIRINREVLSRVSDILGEGESGNIFLLNDMGELLSGAPLSLLSEDYLRHWRSLSDIGGDIDIYSDDKNIIFTKTVDRQRVTIIKTIPLDLIARSSKRIVIAGLFTSGILILVSIFIAVLFSLRISKPIINLSKTMTETSLGDFKKLKIESKDEIGILVEGYNNLMLGMKDMVEREYQSEIDLRNARLNALHAQINPHFLYNTLQLIGGMALVKEAPEIYDVTRAVGSLFRYTTASEGHVVILEKEINHIRNYLMIQELRFKGRCSVSIEIDESIKDILIPQFTLQPILENAFEHGLQPKAGKWSISIRAIQQKKGVLIIISDDGIGMNRDILNSQKKFLLQKKIQKNSIDSHIGLKNVDTRLKLHFGDLFGLRLFSTVGLGTKVLIVIPSDQRGDLNEV